MVFFHKVRTRRFPKTGVGENREETTFTAHELGQVVRTLARQSG